MADYIIRKGFGQVEPNHLSAQTNGQVYAQLPAKSTFNILENGMFLKYDYGAGECNLNGPGEWMLVMNEIKLYDQRKQGLKDYAMKKDDFVDKVMVPRLLKTSVGDIYTTNCLGVANTSDSAEITSSNGAISVTAGTTVLTVNASTGYLKVATTTGDNADTEFLWKVVKVYTMPDGQIGVKLQRIA